MEDERLARIADMLLAGGKMLAVHCGTCMSPLFYYGGKVVCPICGERVRPAEKAEEREHPLDKVEKILRAKIDSLAEQLEKETDPVKTAELLDRIKSTLEALERAKKA